MLQVHQRLGDFEIIRLLGRGGMGEVYEAQQMNPPRRVALKVLAPWLANDPDALHRFWREAAVPAQLDHPGIVRIISTNQTPDGIAFYTMQLVRGLSLAQLLLRATAIRCREGAAEKTLPEPGRCHDTPTAGTPQQPAPPESSDPFPPAVLTEYLADRFRVVARLGARTARALAAAHREGVLHRDVKPSNLMVDQHDQLYIVDFGLTRALLPDGLHTLPGSVRGTPWYMSPEQARGQALDARSDIFSLGVTLYELASYGQGPYTASRQNTDAVLHQVKAGECLPLRVFTPEVPLALARIIERAIQFNPERRYPSAEDLAADLESFEQHGAGTATAPQRQSSWQPRLLLAGAGVIVALLLAGLIWYAGPRGQGEPSSLPPATGHEVRRPDHQVLSLPPELIERKPRVPLNLLKASPQEPRWSCLLAGEGEFFPQPNQLALQGTREDFPALLALDADPERRWYELSVELAQLPQGQSACAPLGIFFGWPLWGPDQLPSRHFFVIQIDEKDLPDAPHGRMTLGWASYQPKEGARGEAFTWFRELPQGQAKYALTSSGVWHTLRIRVVENKIVVTLDGVERNTIEMTWLKNADFTTEPLDPRGALGIWVGQGCGWFRRATTMPLP
jgi:serine/threonine protein kinase